MGYNPVYNSCQQYLATELAIISNTEEAIENLADTVIEKSRSLDLPSWTFPPYEPETDADTIPFFLLANSLNFCYIDPEVSRQTGQVAKYTTDYAGESYSGSNAMWAAMRKAHELLGEELFSPTFLRGQTEESMAEIFAGEPGMPLLAERSQIFNNIGTVLTTKYGGSFNELVDRARDAEGNVHLFRDGTGLVDMLTADFTCFQDYFKEFNSSTTYLNKRAQLAPAMLAGRYESLDADHPEHGRFTVADLDNITVFADYNLPRPLRAFGALKLPEDIVQHIEEGNEIPAGSFTENAIRAATVVQWRKVREAVERKTGQELTDAHIDGAGFLLCRKLENLPPPHYTRTMAY